VIDHIVILAGTIEGPHLAEMLKTQNPTVQTDQVSNSEDLISAASKAGARSRLIAFCTSVIVPETVLNCFPGPSYNFHPGPPEIPGRYPSVWALYEHHERFGVTAHEMKPRVDSGAIVAVDRFDVPSGADLQSLDTVAFEAIIRQFHRLSALLAQNPAPLPHVNESWSGRKYTKADCDALCVITDDLPSAEIHRRRRACGVHFKAKG